MANVGQATFVGSDVIIQCNDKWDCCQREQAAAKVKALNGACPTTIQPKLSKARNRVKKRAQGRESRAMDRTKGDPDARSDYAAADCLKDKLKEPGNTRKKLKLQMDHAVDTKWGGPSDPGAGEMIALDKDVNRFFGGCAKNVGNKMKDKNKDATVKSFSLVCPPSSPGCPGEDHSAGAGKPFPASPKNYVFESK
jgi:hypothetical protein